MKKIIHLIPYDGIGGVESAACSMKNQKYEHIEFKVQFIFNTVTSANQRFLTYNPFPLFLAAIQIAKKKPDILIISLWRAYVVGVLAKLFSPKLKLIAFIHSNKDAHWLDYLFTRLAVYFATEIWADSTTSLRDRLSNQSPENCRIISFLTTQVTPLPKKLVYPSFIFWGRISPEKGLDNAIKLFSLIRLNCSNAKFFLIGPDGGERKRIYRLITELGLEDSVTFLGAMNREEIETRAQEACFYLQTSLFEGMAMSVVEAMQLGLVPVVTPVGEIASYCQHGKNALIIDSEYKVVNDLLILINNDESYQKMSLSAIDTWKNKPLYTESIIQACKKVLAYTHRP